MSLHDWGADEAEYEWPGVHQLWAGEIVLYLKPRLPEGYRATLAAAPKLARLGVAEPDGHVDKTPDPPPVLSAADPAEKPAAGAALLEPDVEVAVPALELEPAVYVSRRGRMIAAIELVSPGNEDSPARRDETFLRYAGYLRDRVNLVLVDVHPRPDRPTLADRFSDEFGLGRPRLPAPFAAVYRVGAFADPGHYLAAWQFPMATGRSLPVVPVPLSPRVSVGLDLEPTYNAAAEVAYFD